MLKRTRIIIALSCLLIFSSFYMESNEINARDLKDASPFITIDWISPEYNGYINDSHVFEINISLSCLDMNALDRAYFRVYDSIAGEFATGWFLMENHDPYWNHTIYPQALGQGDYTLLINAEYFETSNETFASSVQIANSPPEVLWLAPMMSGYINDSSSSIINISLSHPNNEALDKAYFRVYDSIAGEFATGWFLMENHEPYWNCNANTFLLNITPYRLMINVEIFAKYNLTFTNNITINNYSPIIEIIEISFQSDNISIVASVSDIEGDFISSVSFRLFNTTNEIVEWTNMTWYKGMYFYNFSTREVYSGDYYFEIRAQDNRSEKIIIRDIHIDKNIEHASQISGITFETILLVVLLLFICSISMITIMILKKKKKGTSIQDKVQSFHAKERLPKFVQNAILNIRYQRKQVEDFKQKNEFIKAFNTMNLILGNYNVVIDHLRVYAPELVFTMVTQRDEIEKQINETKLQEANYKARYFDDATNNIVTMGVIHREMGCSIANVKLKDTPLDFDLISGLMTAILNINEEIASRAGIPVQQNDNETFDMKLKLFFFNESYIRLFVFSKHILGERMRKKCEKIAREYEKEHFKDISKFKASLQPFEDFPRKIHEAFGGLNLRCILEKHDSKVFKKWFDDGEIPFYPTELIPILESFGLGKKEAKTKILEMFEMKLIVPKEEEKSDQNHN